MTRIAVIDFETTGLSPLQGDRATEIAVLLLEGGQVVDRYVSLMNAGVPVPPDITRLTGISNAMLRAAPPAAVVMKEALRRVGTSPIIAHNASFDRRFWMAEANQVRESATNDFVCTMLLSRRLYPSAPNHQLGTLVDLHQLYRPGAAHRALADAEMAASLLARIQLDLQQQHRITNPDPALLKRLQACPTRRVPAFLAESAAGSVVPAPGARALGRAR